MAAAGMGPPSLIMASPIENTEHGEIYLKGAFIKPYATNKLETNDTFNVRSVIELPRRPYHS